MISLTNARRLEKGMSSMGFVNPFVYSYSSQFVNDITYGNNTCTEADSASFFETSCGCCKFGYYASIGWDPVSGLGTLNYTQFLSVALSMGNGTTPTASPTQKQQSPTNNPTVSPTLGSTFLQVSQELTGFPLNFTDFLAKKSQYDAALSETIVNSTNKVLAQSSSPLITAGDIKNLNVTQYVGQTSTSRKLSSISLLLTYYISTSQNSASQLSTALTTAVTSNDFQTSLKYYAVVNNVPALAQVTADVPNTINLSPTLQPTSPPPTSQKSKLGLIIGITVGFAAGIVVAFFMYQYYKKSNPSKDLTRGILSEPDQDHRISIKAGDVSNPIYRINNDT